jgi:hypothetical protein
MTDKRLRRMNRECGGAAVTGSGDDLRRATGYQEIRNQKQITTIDVFQGQHLDNRAERGIIQRNQQ